MPRRKVAPAVDQTRPSSLPSSSSAPVASTSAIPYSSSTTPVDDGSLLRCSQCNVLRPSTDFPLRLINLQPYQVCFAHEWYWTDAKRLQHWAPEQTSTIQEVCDAFSEISRDDAEYDDRFMVDGQQRDLKGMVESLAKAGKWRIKELKPRRSRAKGADNGPPQFLYAFREESNPKVNKFKLTIWFHEKERKFTMTLRPEIKKDRSEGAWARPERRTGEVVRRGQSHTGQNGRSNPASSSPARNRNASAVNGSSSNLHPSGSTSLTLSRAQQDAQQMPPPPIPPRKKARRVEPSLVSPSLPRPPASHSTSSYSTPTLHYSNALPQNHSTLSLDAFDHLWPSNGAPPTLPIPPSVYANPDSNPSDPTSFVGSSARNQTSRSSTFESTNNLTLFEMLANPAFDPPIIPLLPRPSRTSHSNSTSNSTNMANSNAARSRRELEDAVADALGTRRFSQYDRSHAEEEEEEELGPSPIAEEEEDYEDSIPDDSSEEEDEDDQNARQGGEGEFEDDEDDASSFFESSTEEYSQFGSEEEEEEEEEEEGDDWLAGFVSTQMPGMADAGADDDDDEEESEEGGMEPEPAESDHRGHQIESASNKRRYEGREDSIDDEVDELESSSEE
ncbi:uncharacterized protein JCM6883_005931 [Sporobolomyces salmoneus]|uniref:uncharacterized protein n=1 Tax=Sporobolomyces salmoneus TaxID=183962 RepID=UPI003171AB97